MTESTVTFSAGGESVTMTEKQLSNMTETQRHFDRMVSVCEGIVEQQIDLQELAKAAKDAGMDAANMRRLAMMKARDKVADTADKLRALKRTAAACQISFDF